MDNTNLISTKTQNNISEYLKGMWPVILICGKNGSGKRYVIDSIIKQIESGMPKGVSRNTYLNLVDPESSSISIEDIRDIKKRLKHKISSEDKLRIVVIHDCHRMTQESQNALLKILEETPPRTFFILSVNNKHKLLPTVISRTQILEIRNPTLEEYSRRFNGIDKDKLNKAYLITDGLSRYMKEVIYEPETSTVLKGIDLAKSIVGMEDFQRLCQCDTLIKNDYLETLIFSLKRIYISLLRSSKSNNQINKYTNTLRIILEIEQAINNSSINKKLAITNLLCNL